MVFCVTTLFGTIVVNPLELHCILHPAITPWQIMSIIRRAGTTAKLLAYALSYVPLAYDLIALAMWRLFQTACVIATPAVCYYFILPYIYDWTHNHLVSSLCMHAPLCCARTRTIVIRTCVGIRDPLRRTKGPTVAQQPREGSSAPRPALWQTQRTRPTDDGQDAARNHRDGTASRRTHIPSRGLARVCITAYIYIYVQCISTPPGQNVHSPPLLLLLLLQLLYFQALIHVGVLI